MTSGKYPVQHYELPDGQSLDVGNERFLLAEHLFNPTVLERNDILEVKEDFERNFEFEGLHRMVKTT